ncbi:hypothetical protein BCL57_001211 [Agromyces flavus]|uniref:DUF5671 domain-containing protein n=1 Tax=Agromyces flavus TaxID=589382 RepID=A0A1H1ZEK6_9MICO|nr:DUF5671 domain-containing protein [Agromyces flavus]MCP2367057.1 hypothetical protein [Agromyces flavus]GGI46486.1 hypothetical protein GCM10010932_14860 [Agromyces flavus]SDT32154.1 hypothetical protein SAMN04489721_3136 [Agromyces flavus]
MSDATPPEEEVRPPESSGRAQGTVRRLIVYTLLAVLVVIAAIGVAGLLGRLLESTAPIASRGAGDLALSLAFTLIGGPLAALLWWSVQRRLGDDTERGSLAWGLYLTVLYVVSLAVAVSALLTAADAAIHGRWDPVAAATTVTWALVWTWHRWMLRRTRSQPLRMTTVPLVIAAAYGLVVALIGGIGALGGLLDEAIRGLAAIEIAGGSWWRAPVTAIVTLVVGATIWAWHWFRDDVRRLRTGFADVGLVVVGVLATAATMLTGIAVALFVLLRLAFDPGDPASLVLAPLGTAIAAAVVGGLAWQHHRTVAVDRGDRVQRAVRLVMSGVGLIATASGIGVVLNATLAELVSPLAGSDNRTLLLSGLSALIVGAPVWWLNWRPLRHPDPAEVADAGRRVYLVVVFGVSAIVALVALLVIGYRLFEFVLEPAAAASLVDRIRAPLGVLVATALVFGYHFAVWRRDRAEIAAQGLAHARRIARVILVAAGDTDALERGIAEATGASVTVWRRALDVPETTPDAAALIAALEGVSARRVLLLAGPGDRVEALPLSD